MNPRDVNRINYNNYYVGQNLDFLVRSKMRSESLSTPLKNTPPFYDDQVTAKMSLLGKRGYYDPGYIYGFSDENDNANRGQNQDIMQYEKERFNPREENSSNPILTREQYDQIILPKEHYKEQMMNNYEMYNNPNNNNDYKKYLNERNFNNNNNNMNNNNSNYNDINNNNYNDMNNRNRYNDELLYREKLRMLKERQTPQRLDNFQLDRIDKPVEKNIEEEQNKINKNVNNIEERRLEDDPKYGYNIDDERDRYYYEQILKNNNGMIRNEDKIPNKDYSKQISEYNYINELSKKSANSGNLVLPLTKSQILQGVLIDNFNKKHFSK
jgi:hypothetical protein